MFISKEIKGSNFTHLYFPLAKLGKEKSIFLDFDKGIFAENYKPIMQSILGRQLALNTYYANDLIAMANTRITVDLLKVFDRLKINFKVNLDDITEAERNTALDLAMGQIIESKRSFLEKIRAEQVPEIQTSVKNFINNSITKHRFDFFGDSFNELKGYLEMASSVITSDDKYVATAVAIKRVIDSEQRIFNLPKDEIGETVEHVIKTTQISLMIAGQIDDFDQGDCETLSIISLGHDGGKALIPEAIIYKKGRLTQLENDIMKSHVLLSFILASNNQDNLDFEAFVMALHHVKEDKNLPQSYGIFKDTRTSFYEYLTPEAQAKLNEMYHLTKKYYRVISIADTFEAITAERVYKKASSIGKALEIMLNNNKKDHYFYQPYLDQFILFILNKYLPQNRTFKITEEILTTYFSSDDLSLEAKEEFKTKFQGVILKSCANFDSELICIIYQTSNMKFERKLFIPPIFFLKHVYFQ